MNQWETNLVKSAAAKFQPRRITYRRNYPESPIETGVIDSIAHDGRCKTYCVIPDSGDVTATIVWWDEVINIGGER